MFAGPLAGIVRGVVQAEIGSKRGYAKEFEALGMSPTRTLEDFAVAYLLPSVELAAVTFAPDARAGRR